MNTGEEVPTRGEVLNEPRELLEDTERVLWFDLPSGGDAASVLTHLRERCEGLGLSMLEDLLEPDGRKPYGKRWNSGAIRLASTFGVYSPEANSRAEWWCSKASTELIYQPVELLSSDRWLLTCWHPIETYRGLKGLDKSGELRDREKTVTAVKKRWLDVEHDTAGDLGVILMHQLALTYAPAHRQLYAALEEKEMHLYGDYSNDVRELGKDSTDFRQVSEGLREVWDARALLYDRLTPLNIPGLEDDFEENAWLPAKDEVEIKLVDDYIDRSLKNLRRLSDSLRTSFHNLQLLNADARRDDRDYRQRRIEILAAVFLIPTLIVGFYGANTWVPGEHREWGFIVMIACIVTLTGLAALLIWRMHERDKVSLSRLLKHPIKDSSEKG